jgi:hypothetical protein
MFQIKYPIQMIDFMLQKHNTLAYRQFTDQ